MGSSAKPSMVETPPDRLPGLQHVSTVTRENLPATLALATPKELALHVAQEKLREAYILSTGLGVTLEKMRKAIWKKTEHPGRYGSMVSSLETRDSEVVKACRDGSLSRLIQTLVEPVNPYDSAKSTPSFLSEENGNISIGGKYLLEWMANNKIGPAPLPPRPRG